MDEQLMWGTVIAIIGLAIYYFARPHRPYSRPIRVSAPLTHTKQVSYLGTPGLMTYAEFTSPLDKYNPRWDA